jgi:hypothetical protein
MIDSKKAQPYGNGRINVSPRLRFMLLLLKR